MEMVVEKQAFASRVIRVMVVDDRREVRESIGTLLSLQEDLQVVGEAWNGPVAVAEARRLQPEVILMDVVMPCLENPAFDGLEACHRLKKEGLEAAVIALTVHTDEATRQRAQQAGCCQVLDKGISGEELLCQVRRAGLALAA